MTTRLVYFLFFCCCAYAATITFNATNTQNCASGCSFLNADIWEGGVAPVDNDTVVISSTTALSVYLNGSSIILSSLSASGPITFSLQNGANLTGIARGYQPQVYFTEGAVLSVDNSVMGAGIVGGEIFLSNNAVFSGAFINGTSLHSTNALINTSFLYFDEMNVTHTDFSTKFAFQTNFFYAYGNVTFGTNAPSVTNLSSYNSIPNLVLSNLNVLSRIEINDCVTTITSMTYSPEVAAVSFTATDPKYTANIGSTSRLDTRNLCLFEFHDNMQVTISVASNCLSLTVGNNVSINITDTQATAIVTLAAASTVNISTFAYINLGFFGLLDANVYLGSSGGLIIDPYQNISLNPGPSGSCPISGPGKLIVYGDIYCNGSLSVGQAVLEGTVYAPLLTASYLSVTANSTVNGDVTVSGSGTRFATNPGSLYVTGTFLQKQGSFNVTGWQRNNSLSLRAATIILQDVDAYLSMVSDATDKIVIATAPSITAQFKTTMALYDDHSKATLTVENGAIYAVFTPIQNGNESFLKKHKTPVIIVGCAIGGVIIGSIVWAVVKRNRHNYQPVR